MAASTNLREAQKHNYVAAAEPGAAKARVEIDEFLDDNAMTNLFLLALAEMQKEDPEKRQADGTEDWWTFYSLSSIHGLPAELWNDIPNLSDPNSRDLDSRAKGKDYCTHGSLVFPTWHRVYILMFEQALANKMRDIAERYDEADNKQIYLNAAERFRMPYWDPFVPRNRVSRDSAAKEVDVEIWGLPKILMTEAVYVKYPKKNILRAIANPLRAFIFPDSEILKQKGRENLEWDDAKASLILQQWDQGRYKTARSPGTAGDSNYYGNSILEDDDKQGLVLKIQQQGQNMSRKLFNLLSPHRDDKNVDTRTWESFASHRLSRGGSPDTSISLESWHDNIHGLVGEGWFLGHMGDPAIAGFDPIFWLHHCNIDRLLAIYQALYPQNWISKSGGISPTSALYPFRKNDNDANDGNNYWNSDDVKDWTRLGYAVPGDKTLDADGKKRVETYLDENYHWAATQFFPPESVAKKWPRDLSHSVALYGDDAKPVDQPVQQFEALSHGAKLVTRTIKVASVETPEPVDETKKIIFKDISNNTKIYPEGSLLPGSDNKAMRSWSAQVKVQKFAFNGSFSIHLFIGHIKLDQPERYMTKKNEVGYSYIFASPPSAPCANCTTQRSQGFIYEDAIPLSEALTKYLVSYTDADGPELGMRTLQSFEPEHVVPFLKENLNWVLTNGASGLIDDEERIRASELEISVWDRLYDLPTEEARMGLYHPATLHAQATEGRLGGFVTA